ncbi:MAG: TRIC cation channel family protein, partial [Desulfovibrio sp.]|nr:TRIC cation channel family protein [Desulfovibrio sp.]
MPNDLCSITARYELYDAVALFALAFTSSLRARFAGEKAVGSFLLGFITGLVWPIARELLLGGSVLAFFSSLFLQMTLFLGAVLGTLALFLPFFERVHSCLSLFSLSLTTCFGLLCGLARMEPWAALLLAFFLA